MVGIPAVGKTKYSKELLKLTCEKNFFHSLCFDEIFKFEEKFENKKWKEAQEKMLNMTKELLENVLKGNYPKELEISNQENFILILDDNFYYKSMRYSYLKLCRDYKISFCEVYLTCSLEKSLERNEKRFEKVPEEVIIEMNKKLEIPKSIYDGEFILTIDTTKDESIDFGIREAIKLINLSLLKPLFNESKMKEEISENSRKETLESILHQSDIKLRKMISEKMMKCKENKALVAQKLNEERKKILLDISKNVEKHQEYLENFQNFH